MKMQDKIATGSAASIGKEIALTFAREGTRVVIVVIADRNKEAAEATAGSCRQ